MVFGANSVSLVTVTGEVCMLYHLNQPHPVAHRVIAQSRAHCAPLESLIISQLISLLPLIMGVSPFRLDNNPFQLLIAGVYRVRQVLVTWVGLTWIWRVPRLVGRYCSYLLPKQTGGTTQIPILETLGMIGRPALHCSCEMSYLSRGLLATY